MDCQSTLGAAGSGHCAAMEDKAPFSWALVKIKMQFSPIQVHLWTLRTSRGSAATGKPGAAGVRVGKNSPLAVSWAPQRRCRWRSASGFLPFSQLSCDPSAK